MYNYHTLSENFLQYKRFLGYSYHTDTIVMKEIAQFLTENNVEEITREVTEKYARINLNRHSNTISRNMGVFREFCLYLQLQGINCYQIPKKLYPQNHKNYTPYIFSQQDIKKIYKNLNTPLKNHCYNFYQKTIYPLIIKILYQTGMRIGEVLLLTIKDYNLDEGYFTLKETKNNQERIIALPKSLKEKVDSFINKFAFRFKENPKLFTVSRTTIEKYFSKVLKLSNISRKNNVVLHSLRHTFVVHRIQKHIQDGKNIYNILPILQVHLGHQSLQSLSYYFHMTKDILIDMKVISEEKLQYLIPESFEVKNED